MRLVADLTFKAILSTMEVFDRQGPRSNTMRRLLFAVALAGSWILIGFESRADDDLKLLAGTWKPTEVMIGDNRLPDEVVAKIQLVMEEDRYTVTADETTDKGTLKIDEKQSPKTMDITGTEGPNAGKTILTIYELDGDNLTVCYSLEPGVRPTDLKTNGDSKRLVVKYQRKKN
jgi:uncharacterized protein (TIGR03067 family)